MDKLLKGIYFEEKNGHFSERKISEANKNLEVNQIIRKFQASKIRRNSLKSLF